MQYKDTIEIKINIDYLPTEEGKEVRRAFDIMLNGLKKEILYHGTISPDLNVGMSESIKTISSLK